MSDREKLQAIKGFKDILPEDSPTWRSVESTAREVLETYGYSEIRAPVLEYTDLFARSIGSDTDIVEKEMYTFDDPGGRSLTMRPEGTAGTVRAYIENGLYKSSPRLKVYYIGPMFRRERPQKGRLRQFHQLGVEAFGTASPIVDAEQMAMLDLFFSKVEVSGLELVINSLGCPVCRPAYRKKLSHFLVNIPEKELCSDCLRRRATNPMRVLDCKQEGCQEAIEGVPTIFDDLCDACRTHHKGLEKYLNIWGIKYRVEPKLVRGLDYYTRTAFEFLSGALGYQSAVAAGGRYDGLVEELGGPPTPAVGFAMGIERLMMLMSRQVEQARPDLFLALLGEKATVLGLKLAQALRVEGYKCEIDYESRGLKGQMKVADRLGAGFALILGDGEIESGHATLQNMADGRKVSVEIKGNEADIIGKIASEIRKNKTS